MPLKYISAAYVAFLPDQIPWIVPDYVIPSLISGFIKEHDMVEFPLLSMLLVRLFMAFVFSKTYARLSHERNRACNTLLLWRAFIVGFMMKRMNGASAGTVLIAPSNVNDGNNIQDIQDIPVPCPFDTQFPGLQDFYTLGNGTWMSDVEHTPFEGGWMSVQEQDFDAMKKAFASIGSFSNDNDEDRLWVVVYKRNKQDQLHVGYMDAPWTNVEIGKFSSSLAKLAIGDVAITSVFSVPTMSGTAKPLLTKLLLTDEPTRIKGIVKTLHAFRKLVAPLNVPSAKVKYVATYLAVALEFDTTGQVSANDVWKKMSLSMSSFLLVSPRVDAEEFFKILHYLGVSVEADVKGLPVIKFCRLSSSTIDKNELETEVSSIHTNNIKNCQLRSEPACPCPIVPVSPWHQSSHLVGRQLFSNKSILGN